MLRRRIRFLSLFLLAATALMLLADPVDAARNGRRARRNGNSGYNSNSSPMYYDGTYQPGMYTGEGYAPGTADGVMPAGYVAGMPGQTGTQPQAMSGRRSYYTLPGQRFADGSVQLSVRVPPDAEILIDGRQTMQRGTTRLFVSPPLSPDREFRYEVQARWMENGKEVNRTKSVPVRAGQFVQVDLLSSTGSEELSPPRARQREQETP